MLTFFRRIIHSKVGLIVTLGVLVVIALAFAAGDVTGLRSSGSGGMASTSVATVDGQPIGVAELRTRTQNALQGVQQQQQRAITMAQFVQGGGLDGTLNQLIQTVLFTRFGHDQGMAVSKKTIDGEIAAIPGMTGPTGQFDQKLYEQRLNFARVTDAQVRSDIASQVMLRRLIAPTSATGPVSAKLALPYAALLLEKRHGVVGFIPAKALANGPAPTAAELQAFYAAHLSRYGLPERRIMKYALVTADGVKAQAMPTEAEIAKAYADGKDKYGAAEKRDVTQVSVLDQTAANALAAKVKAGTPIAAAARAAGLEPVVLKAQAKAAYAGQTAAAVADAVFAAKPGDTVGPVRGSLGYIVAHVDAVKQDAGKPLAAVRGEIADALSKTKTQEALGKIHDAMDDAVNGNSTFDEIVGDQKLAARSTAPLTVAGVDPSTSGAKPDPQLQQVVAAGFASEQGDAPQLVPVGQDGSFALVGLDRVVPAAPRPLDQVRDAVTADFTADRAQRAARKVASDVLAKVEKGVALAQALAATNLSLPAPKPLDVPRAQLAANPQGAPPALALMFSMAPRTAKVLEAPQHDGWYVLWLDRIEKGDPSKSPQILAATRADLGRVAGREYVEQFGTAIRRQLGVKRNEAAIAKVRSELIGGGAADQP